jgi:hypothetical protein
MTEDVNVEEFLVGLLDRLLNAVRGHQAILDYGGDPEETDADLYELANEVENELDELGL